MSEEKPERVRTNYPSNSREKKTQDPKTDKKVEKIITGQVVKREKPLGRKIAETFVGDDVQSVGSYILFEVLIPAAKSMISDAASQGVERILFGDASSRRISSRSRNSAPISYNRMHSGSTRSDLDRPGGREFSQRARSNHNFDEIVLETRVEADEVLESMGDVISNYDIVTVADLYDLVGITGSFTDDKWGWSDIRGAGVTRVRNGYLLNLPRPRPID